MNSINNLEIPRSFVEAAINYPDRETGAEMLRTFFAYICGNRTPVVFLDKAAQGLVDLALYAAGYTAEEPKA